jgi:hypothetical protein
MYIVFYKQSKDVAYLPPSEVQKQVDRYCEIHGTPKEYNNADVEIEKNKWKSDGLGVFLNKFLVDKFGNELYYGFISSFNTSAFTSDVIAETDDCDPLGKEYFIKCRSRCRKGVNDLASSYYNKERKTGTYAVVFCDGAVEQYTPDDIKVARDNYPLFSKSNKVIGWYPNVLNEDASPEFSYMVRRHIKKVGDSSSEDLKSRVDMETKFLEECAKLNVDEATNLKMVKRWGWTGWTVEEEEGDEEEVDEEEGNEEEKEGDD